MTFLSFLGDPECDALRHNAEICLERNVECIVLCGLSKMTSIRLLGRQ